MSQLKTFRFAFTDRRDTGTPPRLQAVYCCLGHRPAGKYAVAALHSAMDKIGTKNRADVVPVDSHSRWMIP